VHKKGRQVASPSDPILSPDEGDHLVGQFISALGAVNAAFGGNQKPRRLATAHGTGLNAMGSIVGNSASRRATAHDNGRQWGESRQPPRWLQFADGRPGRSERGRRDSGVSNLDASAKLHARRHPYIGSASVPSTADSTKAVNSMNKDAMCRIVARPQ
jgi:hypothetical protein